jgi:hypothetical protein
MAYGWLLLWSCSEILYVSRFNRSSTIKKMDINTLHPWCLLQQVPEFLFSDATDYRWSPFCRSILELEELQLKTSVPSWQCTLKNRYLGLEKYYQGKLAGAELLIVFLFLPLQNAMSRKQSVSLGEGPFSWKPTSSKCIEDKFWRLHIAKLVWRWSIR